MADTKISALPASTTPLAGTETLPIVQGGATKQVSINNLTAGKTVPVGSATFPQDTGEAAWGFNNANGGIGVYFNSTADSLYFYRRSNGTTLAALDRSGNFTLLTGSEYIGTAGQGINFTANTPAAGMTSQLLNWYEEGTWTPAQGSGLTVVGAFSSVGRYVRIGKQVTVAGSVSGTTSVALLAGGILTNNLPYSTGTLPAIGAATDSAATASTVFQVAVVTIYAVSAIAATTTIYFSVTYNMN